MELPAWLIMLRRAEIVARVQDDPRTTGDGDLLGVPFDRVRDEVIEVPGLLFFPDFLSENEEREIVDQIDHSDWQPDLKRRVQHYGWRYNYKERRVDESMRLGPLPAWAARLGERLYNEHRLPHLPDQVIVNEYVRNQGISKHIDCSSCFADGIAMISLLESWEMIFRSEDKKEPRILQRRSLVVMTGDARYKWQHEIPARLKEPNGFMRGRRLSVTFRKVTPR